MVDADLYQQAIEYYSNMAVEDPARWTFEAWRDQQTWKGRALLVPFNLWGGAAMARGKANGNSKVEKSTQWNTKFVDISLAGRTMEDIEKAFPSYESIFDVATAMLEDGYRFGLSYNRQNDSFICSVTSKDEASANFGCTFTAFAGDWYTALQVALYKHKIVAGEVWGAAGEAKDRAAFG